MIREFIERVFISKPYTWLGVGIVIWLALLPLPIHYADSRNGGWVIWGFLPIFAGGVVFFLSILFSCLAVLVTKVRSEWRKKTPVAHASWDDYGD